MIKTRFIDLLPRVLLRQADKTRKKNDIRAALNAARIFLMMFALSGKMMYGFAV